MKIYTIFLAIILLALSGCAENKLTYMVGTLERNRVEVSVESNEPIIAIHGAMMISGV